MLKYYLEPNLLNQAQYPADANAIGYVLDSSNQQIEVAKSAFDSLPPFTMKAGIFKGLPCHQVEEIATFCRLDILHFVANAYSKEQASRLTRLNYRKVAEYQLSDLALVGLFQEQAVIIDYADLDQIKAWPSGLPLLVKLPAVQINNTKIWPIIGESKVCAELNIYGLAII